VEALIAKHFKRGRLSAVDSNAAPATAAAPSGPTFVAPSNSDATSAPVMSAEVQQQQKTDAAKS